MAFRPCMLLLLWQSWWMLWQYFYINSIVLSWPRINQCQIIYCPLMQSTTCSQGLGLSMSKKKKKKRIFCYTINWYLSLKCALFVSVAMLFLLQYKRKMSFFLRSLPITLECKTHCQLRYKAAGTEQKRHKRLTRIQTTTKIIISYQQHLRSTVLFEQWKLAFQLHNGSEQNHRA